MGRHAPPGGSGGRPRSGGDRGAPSADARPAAPAPAAAPPDASAPAQVKPQPVQRPTGAAGTNFCGLRNFRLLGPQLGGAGARGTSEDDAPPTDPAPAPDPIAGDGRPLRAARAGSSRRGPEAVGARLFRVC